MDRTAPFGAPSQGPSLALDVFTMREVLDKEELREGGQEGRHHRRAEVPCMVPDDAEVAHVKRCQHIPQAGGLAACHQPQDGNLLKIAQQEKSEQPVSRIGALVEKAHVKIQISR